MNILHTSKVVMSIFFGFCYREFSSESGTIRILANNSSVLSNNLGKTCFKVVLNVSLVLLRIRFGHQHRDVLQVNALFGVSKSVLSSSVKEHNVTFLVNDDSLKNVNQFHL